MVAGLRTAAAGSPPLRLDGCGDLTAGARALRLLQLLDEPMTLIPFAVADG